MASDKPIRTQLTDLIEAGAAAEVAAQTVTDQYRPTAAPLVDLAWPLVLREARRIVGERSRAVMKAAMARPVANSDFGEVGNSRIREARIQLRKTVYRMPDGETVLWDDLTAEEIDRKIAWMRTQIGSLVDHLGILERARKLMADRGVDRLGDIDGWVDLVADGASGEEEPPPSVTARKPAASDNGRVSRSRKPKEAQAA